ncbi:MAG: 1,2-phenylacetyl-CoA epoxidase subunit PaaE [Halobacteriales archaeon]
MTRPDPSVDAGGEATAARCPYCGSTDTEREHPKGPGLCRSLHFCHACEQPFETFG